MIPKWIKKIGKKLEKFLAMNPPKKRRKRKSTAKKRTSSKKKSARKPARTKKPFKGRKSVKAMVAGRKKTVKKKVRLRKQTRLKTVPRSSVVTSTPRGRSPRGARQMPFRGRATRLRIQSTAASRVLRPSRPAASKGSEVGTINNYFSKIQVAVLTLTSSLAKGDRITIYRSDQKIGTEKVVSMQINHIPIEEARSGEEIGLKLKTESRAGDRILKL